MDLTIATIIESLEQRGFIPTPNLFDLTAVYVQHCACCEELGEIARHLRRCAQARERLDPDILAYEAADLVIAACCLLARIAGSPNAEQWLAHKLAHDEARGWLHSGVDRATYEAQT